MKEQVEAIESREDLAAFVHRLRLGFEDGDPTWENTSVPLFLEGIRGWTEDLDSWAGQHATIPARPPTLWHPVTSFQASELWLRAGVGHHVLADVCAGTVTRHHRTLADPAPPVAGIARVCSGQLVAVFVEPVDDDLHLLVGRRRLRLDQVVWVEHRFSSRGLASRLRVRGCDGQTLEARDLVIWKGLAPWMRSNRTDPTSLDCDYLFDVADLLGSRERQLAASSYWEPAGTPSPARDTEPGHQW